MADVQRDTEQNSDETKSNEPELVWQDHRNEADTELDRLTEIITTLSVIDMREFANSYNNGSEAVRKEADAKIHALFHDAMDTVNASQANPRNSGFDCDFEIEGRKCRRLEDFPADEHTSGLEQIKSRVRNRQLVTDEEKKRYEALRTDTTI